MFAKIPDDAKFGQGPETPLVQMFAKIPDDAKFGQGPETTGESIFRFASLVAFSESSVPVSPENCIFFIIIC
jgi:hypothetical protein